MSFYTKSHFFYYALNLEAMLQSNTLEYIIYFLFN